MTDNFSRENICSFQSWAAMLVDLRSSGILCGAVWFNVTDLVGPADTQHGGLKDGDSQLILHGPLTDLIPLIECITAQTQRTFGFKMFFHNPRDSICYSWMVTYNIRQEM
jgi:hypothetical protein